MIRLGLEWTLIEKLWWIFFLARATLENHRWTSQSHRHGWRSMWIWVLPSSFFFSSACSCLAPSCVVLKPLWIRTEQYPPPPIRRSRLTITDIWSRQCNVTGWNTKGFLIKTRRIMQWWTIVRWPTFIPCHFKQEMMPVLCQKWIKCK